MAYTAVTYGSESPGGSITATKWNTNFQDVVNGLSDGTKDLNVAAITAAGALTVAGTATLNGNVVLGNASTDTLTVNAAQTVNASMTVASNVSFSGDVTGQRVALTFGSYHGSGVSGYLWDPSTSPVATELGYVMHKNGSVVGFSYGSRVTAYGASNTVTAYVRKSGSDIWASSAVTQSSANWFNAKASATRGTYAFSAGDRIGVYVIPEAANTYYDSAIVEVVFDT